MHLFLFTNSAQRELVSTSTQRIRNSNQLSLPYYLGTGSVTGFVSERDQDNFVQYFLSELQFQTIT